MATKPKQVSKKPTVTKTEERYSITHGDFTLIAKIEAGNKGRITLEKPEGTPMGNVRGVQHSGKRDYHFETSTPEKVEQFALCALEAVRLSREAYQPDAQSDKK